MYSDKSQRFEINELDTFTCTTEMQLELQRRKLAIFEHSVY